MKINTTCCSPVRATPLQKQARGPWRARVMFHSITLLMTFVISGARSAKAADGATLISHTIADGTVMSPGQVFTKTWTLRNSGTTTWTPGAQGHTLNFSSGSDRMDAAATALTLANAIAPNGQVTFRVQLSAPNTPGNYTGNWLMNGANFTDFGPVVSVRIVVRVSGDTYEPDGTPATAKAISNGQTQSRSVHAAGNMDWVTFTLTQRSDVRVQTDGASGDTELWLTASDGATVIEYDDDDGNGNFSLINRTGANALNPGTYYIAVGEYGGDGTINAYTLALTVTLPPPQVAAPTFNPLPGLYEGEVSVSMNTTTAGATIRYTTSGSDPTSGSVQYTGPLRLTQTTMLKARAFKAGMTDSPVISSTYTVTPRPDAFEPDGNAGAAKTIASGERQNRSIHVAGDVDWARFTLTQRSDVRIETDGSTGDTEVWLMASDGTTDIEYDDDDGNGSFSLISRTGANALNPGTYYIAVGEYGGDGTISAYTLALTVTRAPPQVAAPTFNPAPGAHEGEVSVSMNTTTAGATIRYTTSGSDPTGGSVQYTGPLRLTQTTMLKARAFKAGMTDSPVISGTYTVTPRPDAFEPDGNAGAAKTIASGERQNRSIHVAGDVDWAKFTLTQRSDVRIETDGSSGDTELWLMASDGTTVMEYDDDDGNGRFSLINRTGANALNPGTYYIAVGEYEDDGAITGYTLALTVTLAPAQVAAPTFNPLPGAYEGEVSVSMNTTTAGATIRYTTSGSDPSSGSTIYTTPVRLTQTRTLKARALNAGMTESPVTTGTYTITPRRDDFEADDTPGTAKTISFGQTQSRSINSPQDVDWVKFTLTQTSEVVIVTSGPSGDTEISLYGPDSSTTLVDSPNYNDDEGPGLFSRIERRANKALRPGTYFLAIQSFQRSETIPTYMLSLRVGSRQTAFVIGTNDDRGNSIGGDSFRVVNKTGTCLGMSAYAKWFFEKRSGSRGPLFPHFKVEEQERIARQAQDDLDKRALKSRFKLNNRSDYDVAESMKSLLDTENKPQILLMSEQKFSDIAYFFDFLVTYRIFATHAVLVIDYDEAGGSGKFKIYNNWYTNRESYLDYPSGFLFKEFPVFSDGSTYRYVEFENIPANIVYDESTAFQSANYPEP